MKAYSVVLFLLMSVAGCSHFYVDKGQESHRFNEFLDRSFDEFLQQMPESLSYFGKKDRYAELNDYSEAFEEKMWAMEKKTLAELLTFDRSHLNEQAALSYDLVRQELEENIQDFQWRAYKYAVNQQAGVHTDLPTFMINIHKVSSEQDLKDYISRLKEFPRVFRQVGEQIRRSAEQGIVPPQFVFPSLFISSQKILTGQPFQKTAAESPLWSDFKSKLHHLKLKDDLQKKYLQEAQTVLRDSVAPAYKDLLVVVREIQKKATTDDGAWKFPRGNEFYNRRLENYTTTKMTAEQIHEMGLKNVARLRGDMEALKKKVGFKGSLKEFFAFVRKDPQQYYPNTEKGRAGYLQQSNETMAKIQQKIPLYFRLIPKTPMVIKAVEKYREEGAGKAFYQEPSDDGSRPGTYYVNLRNMKDAAKFEAEALFYHEGIPGHHFQIALAIEMRDLPKYRRYGHYTAFVEGWALYTERLAKEMGGYSNDYAELGRLTMEMTRACRLVVDTGIHAKKWSRQQAIDFMMENLPVNKGMVEEQVGRYIVWPGQATAYMVGMLKIVELREKAQATLGERFDIRDFHDVVLQNGAVSLKVLEDLVNKYIQQRKQK